MEFKINIPKKANELIQILHKHGHSAYVVGGCVRDSILGRKPNDWDICTSATPDEMLKIFKDKRIIETGLQHGTVTVVNHGEPFEITTYRIDGKYSDNRKPDSVEFTNDLLKDLGRRDFTINAMAYNDEVGLIDPFGGLEAIEYKQIGCVGSAKDRFNEDALRILRAIRFAAQLEFVIMPGTSWEIHQQYENLKNVSIERINNEFCKIAVSENFCVELLLYPEVFALFIPEIKKIIGFDQNNSWHVDDVFTHTVHAIEHCNSTDLIVRLAIFFHDIGKPYSYQDDENGIRHFKNHNLISSELTNLIMKRLRFDNVTREKVVTLVRCHNVELIADKKNIKQWLNKIGVDQFKRLLVVKEADNKAQNLQYSKSKIEELNEIKLILEELLKKNECFSLQQLAINGNDLIHLGFGSGKKIGIVLNKLLNLVIEDASKNDKDILLNIAKGWLGVVYNESM